MENIFQTFQSELIQHLESSDRFNKKELAELQQHSTQLWQKHRLPFYCKLVRSYLNRGTHRDNPLKDIPFLDSDLSELIQKQPDIVPVLDNFHHEVVFRKDQYVDFSSDQLNAIIFQHFMGIDRSWGSRDNHEKYNHFKQAQLEKERVFIQSLVSNFRVTDTEQLKEIIADGHQVVIKKLQEISRSFDFCSGENPCVACGKSCLGSVYADYPSSVSMCAQCYLGLATGQLSSAMKKFLMDYFNRDHDQIFWRYGFWLPGNEILASAKTESKKGLLFCPLCEVDLLAPPEKLTRYGFDKVIFEYTADRSVFICTECYHRKGGRSKVRNDEQFNSFRLSFWDQLWNSESIPFLSKEQVIAKIKEELEAAIFWPVHNKKMTREQAVAGYSDFVREIMGMKGANDGAESNGEMEVESAK